MEKYFKLKSLGVKIKFSKKSNKFLIKGVYRKFFFELSDENLEQALDKFYNFSIELIKEIKKSV